MNENHAEDVRTERCVVSSAFLQQLVNTCAKSQTFPCLPVADILIKDEINATNLSAFDSICKRSHSSCSAFKVFPLLYWSSLKRVKRNGTCVHVKALKPNMFTRTACFDSTRPTRISVSMEVGGRRSALHCGTKTNYAKSHGMHMYHAHTPSIFVCGYGMYDVSLLRKFTALSNDGRVCTAIWQSCTCLLAHVEWWILSQFFRVMHDSPGNLPQEPCEDHDLDVQHLSVSMSTSKSLLDVLEDDKVPLTVGARILYSRLWLSVHA